MATAWSEQVVKLGRGYLVEQNSHLRTLEPWSKMVCETIYRLLDAVRLEQRVGGLVGGIASRQHSTLDNIHDIRIQICKTGRSFYKCGGMDNLFESLIRRCGSRRKLLDESKCRCGCRSEWLSELRSKPVCDVRDADSLVALKRCLTQSLLPGIPAGLHTMGSLVCLRVYSRPARVLRRRGKDCPLPRRTTYVQKTTLEVEVVDVACVEFKARS